MTTDDVVVSLTEVYADESLVILTARGELSVRTTPELRRALDKALAAGGAVIVDVTGLSIRWTPAAHVFGTALRTGGGWPQARLALAGASPELTAVLRSTRVGALVHLAPDVAAARRLLTHRPARVWRVHDLPATAASAGLARALVRAACSDWEVTDDVPVAVASELVTNAVEHARSRSTLTLTLDGRGFTVSVHDTLTLSDCDADTGGWPDRGHGLSLVAALARAWGVRPHGGGKTVWATLPV